MAADKSSLEKQLEDYRFALSKVSHEVRNPVTLINSYLQLLEKDHPEFQLNTYNNIFLMNGLRWDEEVMTKADVSNANGQVVMALILGAIRAERFCDGTLKDFLELGCIEKWLLRLQEIASKI